jgi:hypothetical protein
VLTIELIDVGPDLKNIPLKARCRIPNVEIHPVEFVDFKRVFLKNHKVEGRFDFLNIN